MTTDPTTTEPAAECEYDCEERGRDCDHVPSAPDALDALECHTSPATERAPQDVHTFAALDEPGTGGGDCLSCGHAWSDHGADGCGNREIDTNASCWCDNTRYPAPSPGLVLGEEDVRATPCMSCDAEPGAPCMAVPDGLRVVAYHPARIKVAALVRAADQRGADWKAKYEEQLAATRQVGDLRLAEIGERTQRERRVRLLIDHFDGTEHDDHAADVGDPTCTRCVVDAFERALDGSR